MLILYVASTGDGWEEFMWAGMDVRGVDVAPERNDHSANSLFFIAWMIVGSFVALNLFVGAIVDNFTRIKQETEGSATMTPEQQQWVNAMKSANTNASRGAREPSWWPRKKAFRLITSQPFEFGVMGVIGLNVFGMALEYDRMDEDTAIYTVYRDYMLCFTYFYYAEFALKFFAMGCQYFQDAWCRFDFLLVCISAMDQFFLELLMTVLPIPPTVLRVLRVARVLRILRLLKNLKGLRDLVMTLVFAFPSLVNVSALLGIVMYMYSVLGMNTFTYVMHGDDLNEHNNFESFAGSMLLLFQCLTGDGWSAMMDDAMVNEERGCDPQPDDGSPSDCGSPIALPFFISYMVIGCFVFLNLFVAVILENFTALGNTNPDLVSANDISDFKDEWALLDPDANALIPTKSLPTLVMNLKAPLGLMGTKLLDGPNPRAKALRFCLALGLTQRDGEVAFKPVLDALIKKNYSAKQVAIDAPTLPEPEASPGTPAAPTGNEVYTPRRRDMAGVYADELISTFIKTRKSLSPDGSPVMSRRTYERKKEEPPQVASQPAIVTKENGSPGSDRSVGSPPLAQAQQSGSESGTPPVAAHANGKGRPGGAKCTGGNGGAPSRSAAAAPKNGGAPKKLPPAVRTPPPSSPKKKLPPARNVAPPAP